MLGVFDESSRIRSPFAGEFSTFALKLGVLEAAIESCPKPDVEIDKRYAF